MSLIIEIELCMDTAGSCEVNNLVLTLFSPAGQIWGINSIDRHHGIYPNNILLTVNFGVA
jgi:hypothetical protein